MKLQIWQKSIYRNLIPQGLSGAQLSIDVGDITILQGVEKAVVYQENFMISILIDLLCGGH